MSPPPAGGRRWRVVYIDHTAALSGGELALARLVPELVNCVDPLVILGEDGPLAAMLERDGIPVRVEPMVDRARTVGRADLAGMARASASSASYALRLARVLRAEHADLVHTNSLKAHLYGGAAGRLAGVPVLWHLRDRIAADYLPRTQVRLVRSAARLLPKAVVANSRATASTLTPALGRRVTATVIPSAVPALDLSGFDRDDERFTVTSLGRLAPWKGQDVFLRAFADAFAGTDARAVVAGAAQFGEDSFARSLAPLAARLGIRDQVEFTGHVKDIRLVLARTDVLVHSSVLPEPFGQVIVEGLAAGVPVIAADAGGAAEIISNGVDGLLTPPADAAALAAAMQQLHSDPALRTKLTSAGRQAAARYRPKQIAEEMIAVYRRMLEAGKTTVGSG